MKKILLACLILSTAGSAPAGGVPVFDWANLIQSMLQVMLASNQLDIASTVMKRAGDPASVVISSASTTLSQLGQPGVAKTLPKIQSDTTGQSGQAYDGDGLYTAVPSDITLSDGRTIARPPEPYRKHEALQQTIVDYNAVIADTQPRRDALREAQVSTTEQLKAATTDAEIQKLQVVLAAQDSALNTVTAERSEAADKVAIQKAANEADKARQEQADDELRAVSLQTALLQAMQLFQADTKPMTLPNPRSIDP